MPEITALCDWVNLLVHDLRGPYENRTRFVSPLIAPSGGNKVENTKTESVVSTKIKTVLLILDIKPKFEKLF